MLPMDAVTTSSGTVVMDSSKANFQGFSSSDITSAQSLAEAGGIGVTNADKVLGYGYAVRCITNCTANSRAIGNTSTGQVSIGLRVPQAAVSTTYGFIMTFVVIDESVSRVTRNSVFAESIAQVETRGTAVTATELMQLGINPDTTAITNSLSTPDFPVSSNNASYHALTFSRVATGTSHSCGLTAEGVGYCWGLSTNGRLGNNSTAAANITSPVTVKDSSGADSALRFKSISVGSLHSCALTLDGVAYCWGAAANGRLGNNTTTPDVAVPTTLKDSSNADSALRFISISADNTSTCAVATDGKGYCWGAGASGKLGSNATTDQTTPQTLKDSSSAENTLRWLSIEAGRNSSCGIATNNEMYCWGSSSLGQLGNNSTTTGQLVPGKLKNSSNADSTLRFSHITAAFDYNCAVELSGEGYCWGDPALGELGNNTSTGNVLVPGQLKDSSNADSALRFKTISGYFTHTCGITTTGETYCWGQGSNGKLGNNATTNQLVPVQLKDSSNANSILRFVSVHTGSQSTCGLTVAGEMYCWGNNTNGQLGINSIVQSLVPTLNLLGI
jgi:alpha-tubulin suppressor-like RCC1 family protein